MEPLEPTTDETQYSLQQLTDLAGVSARTVRYYITEGLLPPPVVAGPQSHYTGAHLSRLQLIGRLKDAYLPLREIRRQISALSDQEIEDLLVEDQPAASAPLPLAAPSVRQPASDDAAAYIARALNFSSPVSPLTASSRQAKYSDNVEMETAPAYEISHRTLLNRRAPADQSTAWRRVPLSDDAELHITEDAYQRKRERIDWLIEWARKVFD
jgi:DNA-binding transcriptional MerR regulator